MTTHEIVRLKHAFESAIGRAPTHCIVNESDYEDLADHANYPARLVVDGLLVLECSSVSTPLIALIKP